MSASDSFLELRSGLFAGDENAAAKLFAHYAARLVALARARLGPRLRAKVDPEDIVQSAFHSFFLRCSAGRFDLDSPEQLWSLLVLFTLRKCGRQFDLYGAKRRDAAREAHAGWLQGDEESAVPQQREPGPEEAAILADTVEHVAGQLSSPLKRQIFDLSLQGHSIAEIAEQTQYYERGVERVRAEIHRLVEQLLDA
ncbi:MAG TPA: ECF-type sigma factor [Gemmataceae bacterium]|nr:ECF-type sigma factor [Gemmataceae bacterium]